MKVFVTLLLPTFILSYANVNAESPAKEAISTLEINTDTLREQDASSLEEAGFARVLVTQVKQQDEDEVFPKDEQEGDDSKNGRGLRRLTNKCAKCTRSCEKRCRDASCFAGCPTQCKTQCIGDKPICEQPIITGRCNASIKRWAYNPLTGKCTRFIYTGCQGNDNSFSRKRECKKTCIKKCPRDKKRCSDGSKVSRDHRKQCAFRPCPVVVTQCEEDLKICPDGSKVGRNPDKECRFFKCEQIKCPQDTLTCSDGTILVRNTEDCNFPDCKQKESCSIPIKTEKSENCHSESEKWKYDNLLKRCVKSKYGGCGENSNNFETEEACQKACPLPLSCNIAVDHRCPDGSFISNTPRYKCDVAPCSECFESIDPGMCRAAFVRYAYNSDKQRCEKFIWGGCGANRNNFETLEACDDACKPSRWRD